MSIRTGLGGDQKMTESKNTFSKADIIRLAVGREELSKLDADYKSNEKRLSKIIDFIERKYLTENPQDFEMKRILEKYFTLIQPSRNTLEKNRYTYSLLDAVLLATLLKSDVVDLLNDINKLKYSFDYNERYNSFIESFNDNLKSFENFLKENIPQKVIRKIKNNDIEKREEERMKEDKIFELYFLKITYPLNSIAHYIVSSEYFSAFEKEIHNYFARSKRVFNRLTKNEKYDFLLHSDFVRKALIDLEKYELQKEANEEEIIYYLKNERNKYYRLRMGVKEIIKIVNKEIKKIEKSNKNMSPLFGKVEKMLQTTLKEINNCYFDYLNKSKEDYGVAAWVKVKDQFENEQFEEGLKDLKSVYVSVKTLNDSYTKQFMYGLRKQLKEMLENVRDKIREADTVSEEVLEKGLEEILSKIQLINDNSSIYHMYEIKEHLQHVFEEIHSSMNNGTFKFNYPIKEKASKIIKQFEESENKVEDDDDVYVLIEQQMEDLLDLMRDKEAGEKKKPDKENNINLDIAKYVKAELNLPNYNFSKDYYDGKTYIQLYNILTKKEKDLEDFKEEINYIYDLLKY